MADGPPEPEPDDGGRPEEGRILSPEELDISESEHVEQLDEDRFVVSPDARVDSTPADTQQPQRDASSETDSPHPERESEPDPAQTRDSEPREQPATELTQQRVHRWLRESFVDNSSRYGFDVTATFDGSVSQRRMASNDVVTIFESLVLWYAQQVDSDTPVEEILGILLMEANVPVRYPPESLKRLVKSAGLGPEDTVADLLAAVDEKEGLEL
ncbi:MAG: hypothetical protein V5A39_00810 [Haloarculaceae archaeon]